LIYERVTMRLIRVPFLFCLFLFPLVAIGGSLSSMPDSSLQSAYEELKNKTEALFEAKKDSFAFVSDNSVSGGINGHVVFSFVSVGPLFASFQRHAVIGYSLNDSTLYVEVRQLIGQVWVRRFRNTSSTRWLVPGSGIPAVIRDINGDGLGDLLILQETQAMLQPALRYGAWLFSLKEGFQEVKGFNRICNPVYDVTEKKVIGFQPVSCNQRVALYEEYRFVKGPAVERKRTVLLDCCCATGECTTCKVIVDGKERTDVPRSSAFSYVPVLYKEQIKALCK
jgi:hypothetical protein